MDFELFKEEFKKTLSHSLQVIDSCEDSSALKLRLECLKDLIIDLYFSTRFQSETARPIIQPKEVERAHTTEKKKEDSSPHLYEIQNFSYKGSERPNDCGIVAIANICQISYKDARIEAFTHGWSSTKGMVRGFVELICKKHRLDVSPRNQWIGRSVQFLADHPEKGVFIIYCEGHVMPMINGELYNWTQTSYKVITEVYEVFPLV